MANKELLIKVLEHIRANPTEWDQKRFSCCFAGWTMRLAALRVEYGYADTHEVSGLVRDGELLTAMDIDREAAALLGLTREQQIRLFCGGNSLADLEAFVSALIEGRPMPAHACAVSA